MKRFFLFLICILFSDLALAEFKKYPVREIPENMKQGMYAVIREKESRFEILSIGKSSYYVHFAITILNERGKFYASEVVGYDKNTKITQFKGTAYDASGEVIKKLKQSEIYDQSAISGFSLYEDDRKKFADLTQATYPYTVEFEYETQNNYLYYIPRFILYSDDEVSIEKSSFTVVYPKTIPPRFKLTGVDNPEKIDDKGRESVTWRFQNIIPSKFEPNSPDITEYVPNIFAGPSEFEYEDYRGDMSTWKGFGQWNNQLMKNRGVLPEATRSKVKELTARLSTTEEKSRVLYEYLQSKTRYVSIQLGIGGLQPFEASVVDQNGYGDCKALSNYMVALLREAGVSGYYTIINAGDDARPVVKDFPSHQSNHVIVAVPNGKDTLWLECTSQTNPFGYLGTFTGDRSALLIADDGGHLVHTQSYTLEENTQFRKGVVKLGLTGDAQAKIITTVSGLQYENGNLHHLLNASAEDQKKWVQGNTDIPGFDINSFSMTNRKNKIPSADVHLDLSLKRYASVSGKRLFLIPNLMNRYTSIPKKVETRKTNVVRKMSYMDVDTVVYQIPEELYPEFMPQPIKITSRFGEYESSFKIEQGTLVYIRKMKMKKGEYPPESYNELIEFYKSVVKADNTKIVFLNKT